jgi:cytochrome c oxidase subunit II
MTDWMTGWMKLPKLASAHGGALDYSLGLVHVLMLVLFVGWGAFFLYTLFRFRKGRNPQADYVGVTSHRSTWLEGAVALAEAVLLVGFSIPLWADRVDRFPSPKEATVVRVVGEQFTWNTHYPGPDEVFGKTDVAKLDVATNPLGLDRSDPAAQDDIVVVGQLHVPVNKPVIVYLSSKDVIHSFALNEMRVKQDAIPGHVTPVWFTPTVTTDDMRARLGGNPDWTYEIACAQLCGIGHAKMRGFLHVDTPEQYKAWFDQKTLEQAGGEDVW